MTPRTKKIAMYAGAAALVAVLLGVVIFGAQDVLAGLAALIAAVVGGWAAKKKDAEREADLEKVRYADEAVSDGRERLV
jgi:hypothetical protein